MNHTNANNGNKIRVSVRIENKERYVMHLDKSQITQPFEFVRYVCATFALQFKHTYVLLLEPDMQVRDIGQIGHNDKLRIVQKPMLDVIRAEMERLRKIAMGDKMKLDEASRRRIQMSTFGQQQGYRNNPYSNKNGYSNHVYRDARFMIAVRKPIKLAEKVDYDDIKNNMVQVMTPDIEDFASKIVDASNKKELCQTAKILAMTKGFRLVVPYAKQESRITLM